MKKNGIFTVSVLSEETSGTVIGTLGFNSGKDVDKLAESTSQSIAGGVPVQKILAVGFYVK